MTFLSATFVALYERPNGLPKFIAGKPDLLGLTDATSNVTAFPTTGGCTTLWLCAVDAFIALVVTRLPRQMTIDAKVIRTINEGARMPLFLKVVVIVLEP